MLEDFHRSLDVLHLMTYGLLEYQILVASGYYGGQGEEDTEQHVVVRPQGLKTSEPLQFVGT